MTIFLPLEAASSSSSTSVSTSTLPQTPSFLVPSPDPREHVKKVIKAITKARRIAVVCGAGISVQAGIPDFRSSEGLFQSLKRDNPTLSSGKDLFDASVFSSEGTTSLFCQMIAQLSEMSQSAAPTTFHKLLRTLDERNKLLRVYTQNIDALESKSGLTFGVPELEAKRTKPRSTKGKQEGLAEEPLASSMPHTPSNAHPSPSCSRLPTPPAETPRCIPLHGTLQLMHCQTCTHSFPLRDHLEALASGHPPYCPECTALEETRQLVGKRMRGVGKLRPSVVLYNEVHKDGEEVGEAVRRDLVGSSKGKGRAGADLLLVVGTSLRVPGTKRIVREFSKAVRHPSSQAGASSCGGEPSGSTSTTGLATPTPSPRRTPAGDEEPPVKTVYLNFDFPVPTREWEGVFDVWIRGDVQEFAQMVEEEMEKEANAKEAAIDRKKKRLEAALAAVVEEEKGQSKGKGKKRKDAPADPRPSKSTPVRKKRKVVPYLTPESTTKKPPRKRRAPVENDVLPTLPASTKKDKPLSIRIPPLSQRRLVPEVVVPSVHHRKKIRTQKLTIPGPPPPSSPPSPISYVPSTRPRKTSISIDHRSPNHRLQHASHIQRHAAFPSLDYDGTLNASDTDSSLTDLADSDSPELLGLV